jgi:hypothetical protein
LDSTYRTSPKEERFIRAFRASSPFKLVRGWIDQGPLKGHWVSERRGLDPQLEQVEILSDGKALGVVRPEYMDTTHILVRLNLKPFSVTPIRVIEPNKFWDAAPQHPLLPFHGGWLFEGQDILYHLDAHGRVKVVRELSLAVYGLIKDRWLVLAGQDGYKYRLVVRDLDHNSERIIIKRDFKFAVPMPGVVENSMFINLQLASSDPKRDEMDFFAVHVPDGKMTKLVNEMTFLGDYGCHANFIGGRNYGVAQAYELYDLRTGKRIQTLLIPGP